MKTTISIRRLFILGINNQGLVWISMLAASIVLSLAHVPIFPTVLCILAYPVQGLVALSKTPLDLKRTYAEITEKHEERVAFNKVNRKLAEHIPSDAARSNAELFVAIARVCHVKVNANESF